MAPAAPLDDAARLIEARRIWDEAPHCAFTDLIRFDGRWLCTFREGQRHVSPDGAIRVIASEDGERWEPIARLTSASADLRDPKLCTSPDGRLMLTAAAALHDPGDGGRHQTLAWFSQDGASWDGPHPIGRRGDWLWRVSWHDGTPYSVGYSTEADRPARVARLYRGADGRADAFEAIVDPLFEAGEPSEATLRFLPDGQALCLLRRDGAEPSAQLGQAEPPYLNWTWTDLGVRVGGPNLIRLPDGRLIAVVRLYDGGPRTAVCRLDPGAGTLTELLALPSGGDTSYAGLAWHAEQLWISYYSSHEGRTAIYLARVALPDPS
ncbi:exo-alpha-sialidase [Tautonia sociabilis]|uniref:Exo-alpha-sialidase n=1 Tax=Tautonia sociabilis TaxID=2080755 RepID=A0A432MDU5_9BACT|nr:exo-alpha-sialidase [Tautonia sociabilis]